MAFLRKHGLALIALALVIAGVVLLWRQPEIGFGWTAYAPLNGDAFIAALLTSNQLAGWVCIIVGLVLFAGWAGYRLGRTRV